MAISFAWEDDGVVITWTGTITEGDFQSRTERLVLDPRYKGIKWVISDFSKAQRALFHQQHVEKVVESVKHIRATNPIPAVVYVCNGPIFRGYCQFLKEHCSSVQPMHIVSTHKEARAIIRKALKTKSPPIP